MVYVVGEIHAQPADEVAANWHQWRGPEANGVSRTARPPIEWSESRNIQWKVAIDGKGGAGQRGAAQRAFIQALAGIGKAAAIALGDLDITEQMVTKGAQCWLNSSCPYDAVSPEPDRTHAWTSGTAVLARLDQQAYCPAGLV